MSVVVAVTSSLPPPTAAVPPTTSHPAPSASAVDTAFKPDIKPASSKLDAFKLPDVDLQRVAPSVVVQVKKQMDVVFEANRKRPGEDGYVYNVEVEFEEGHESNEWDEEEDE